MIDHSMTAVPLLLLYLLRIAVISAANDFASMARLASVFHPKPPKWSSNSSSFCDWYGVTCDPTNKYVYGLNLRSMDISGSLPLQFPSLPFLKVLDLSQNSLSGSAPSLVKLISLESLALDENKFTNITKDFFLRLPASLQTLDLSYNLYLAPWKLPFEISRLKNLSLFDASNTCLEGTMSDISGSLTPEFPPLPSLKWLDLSDNSLSGSVPSVAKLTSLESLYLLENKFTEITEDFFLSLPTTLKILDLSNNVYLSPWVIPSGFLQLKNLSEFSAGNACLGGTIPDIFSFLPLQYLFLSYNNLSGVLPQSLGKSQLLELHLSNQVHGLSGSLNTLSTILSLEFLDLSNNKFTGPVPDFSDCTNLEYISLDGNMLQGPYPKFLLQNASKHVDVDGNSFCTTNGETCDPQVTQMLEIAGCFGYPFKLADSWKGNDVCRNWSLIECNLQNEIVGINFANQDFHGKICSTFSKLKLLQYLYLNDNHLTGSIPESLLNLPHLLVLDVANNNLSGRIPPFKPSVKLIFTGNLLLSTSDSSHKGKRFIANVTIIGLEILCTILGVICIIHIGRRKLIEHREGKGETDAAVGKEVILNIFNVLGKKGKQVKIEEAKTIQSWELVIATDNYHPSNKLGQGGFGTVYKGKLQDGREVAVKRLSHASTQGLEEFVNEVLVTSKLQHRNVIRLLACCVDGEEKMLVYEHMPNKSLDAFLFDATRQKALDWRKRCDILKGISSGLHYLHKECREQIIHRDLNASNILLDEELNPKISDFGTSRIVRSDEEQANTMKIVGTHGYMPPEYAMKGQFSEKSDVFSFGVLILEIVSGRSNTSFCNDEQSSSLLEHAWTLWKGGDVVCLIDPVVYEQCFLKEILKCIHVGLLCVQHSVECRPTISSIISMLESDVEGLPAPRPPAFVKESK